MADDLMAKVRADGKSIRTLTVKVRYNDMAEDQCGESLLEPTDLETDVYGRIHNLFRQAWKRRVSLRLVSLKLSNVYDGIFRAELALERSAEQHEARRRLAGVVDELRSERGREVLLRGHDFLLRRGPTDMAKLLTQESTKKPRVIVSVPVRRVTPTGYVPLSVHSVYSFLNSTLTIDAIVALAKQRGLPAIALADTGNLHGAVEFAQAAKRAGIKPILGATVAGGRSARPALRAERDRLSQPLPLALHDHAARRLRRRLNRAASGSHWPGTTQQRQQTGCLRSSADTRLATDVR